MTFHLQTWILIIFSNLLWILHRIWLFCLKIVKSWPIQIWSIANVFSNTMKYNGANLCANSTTNMHTDKIFQFLTIFAQILTILPQNSKVLNYTAWNHGKYHFVGYELLFCQILWHSIFKRGYYLYFPFSCDFFTEIFKEKDAFLALEFL